MAQVAFGASLGQALPGNDYLVIPKALAAPSVVSTAAYDADAVTTAAAIATAVALGASPTQASVTAINNAYIALAADYATLKTAINTSVVGADDVAITMDGTKFTKKNQVRVAVRKLLSLAIASASFT